MDKYPVADYSSLPPISSTKYGLKLILDEDQWWSPLDYE